MTDSSNLKARTMPTAYIRQYSQCTAHADCQTKHDAARPQHVEHRTATPRQGLGLHCMHRPRHHTQACIDVSTYCVVSCNQAAATSWWVDSKVLPVQANLWIAYGSRFAMKSKQFAADGLLKAVADQSLSLSHCGQLCEHMSGQHAHVITCTYGTTTSAITAASCTTAGCRSNIARMRVATITCPPVTEHASNAA